VFGSGYEVGSTRYEVLRTVEVEGCLGTWYMVLCTLFLVNGPQSMVHSSGMFSWKFVLLLDSCFLLLHTAYCLLF
jgi:hypothetical protein